jgi:hypothetical protein
MEVGDAMEAKISMLKILLQFGATEAIKKKAQKELMAMAFGEIQEEEDNDGSELSKHISILISNSFVLILITT